MKTKDISIFLNNELYDYAMDVIENRAIPSVIDGLKPTARKVIFVADKIWRTGNEKPIKVFQMAGRMAADAYYHHGDASANAVITGMGQTFKNNLQLLEGVGQYGSLRSPSAGAPRYISTKLSPNFRNIYKDFELLTPQLDEGVTIEPQFFLPIIPTVIINGSSGIAVGFASNILNRNPKDVIDACIDYLKGKKIKELKPFLYEFSGDWVRDLENPNKWWIKGIYEVVNTTTVHITDVPPQWTFEKYESYLDDLIDKKKIKDYENNSSSTIDYTLKFKREDLTELIKTNKLEDFLKINSSDTENLTTLDENGKLKIFSCVEDIVKYFVDFRLGYYQKRKDYLIDKYSMELKELCYRAKFIKSIIDKKLVVNNKPKNEIVSWLEENKFEKIDGSFNYLLNMPIYSLTKERYDDLISRAKLRKQELDEMKERIPRDMYLEDLQELKKKIK